MAKLADGTLATVFAATKVDGGTTYVGARSAPVPYTLGVQPKDNRLVAWGFAGLTSGPNGTASSPSHAYVSQPDAPEKWDETDFVILAPGDGETGRAAATYNDFLFLFKQSKFFVFYGNSVDNTGGTVFNYRTVGNAFGGSSSAIYQGQVCSAPSGVYVITDTGVWKTTGGAPQLVSPALSPLTLNGAGTAGFGTSTGTLAVTGAATVSTTLGVTGATTLAAASATAWRPEAQKRLRVIPGTVSGRPARSRPMRATFIPCSASGMAQPQMTSPMRPGSRAGTCATTARKAWASRSSGRVAA
jgi:hypothetical protein